MDAEIWSKADAIEFSQHLLCVELGGSGISNMCFLGNKAPPCVNHLFENHPPSFQKRQYLDITIHFSTSYIFKRIRVVQKMILYNSYFITPSKIKISLIIDVILYGS